MKQKYFILSVILLFFCLGASFRPFGCKTVITGTVTDQAGEPIEGAIVSIEGFTPLTTGADGTYTFEDVSYDEGILITVTCEEYEDNSSTIDTSYINNGITCKDIEGTDIQLISSYTTIIAEDFESYQAGNFINGTGGWEVVIDSTASATVDAMVGAENTGKSLRLEAQNNSVIDLIRTFDATSIPCIDFEGYVMFSSTVTVEMLAIAFMGESVGVYFIYDDNYDTPYFLCTGGSPQETGVSIQKNIWYKITMHLDLIADEWSARINNGTEINGTFGSDYIPASFIIEYMRAPQVKAYIDELRIRYPK